MIWIFVVFWFAADGQMHSHLSPRVYLDYEVCMAQMMDDENSHPEEWVWGNCHPLPGIVT